jgi:hypothetical protein
MIEKIRLWNGGHYVYCDTLEIVHHNTYEKHNKIN